MGATGVPAEAEDVAWTVHGPDGQATATLSMPAHLEVLDVDVTHVLAGWKDDLDVEYVSSYRDRALSMGYQLSTRSWAV